MNENSNSKPAAGTPAPGTAKRGKDSPQWATGLKQIYDSVLEEPLPDSFKDLLSKLDDGETE